MAGLEQEKLSDEHSNLLTEIEGYLELLGDTSKIYALIKSELEDIARRFGDDRRTEISGEELGSYNMEDLITEETMVVTISHRGYAKRLPATTYRAQRRGGKGVTGMKLEEEDPVEHLFVASTHDYLLFFTNQGKVYWQKVYEIPQMSRESKGRALVNLLNLTPEEKIMDCLAIRDFDLPDHYLIMATKKGVVKKTDLEQYSRPKKGGIIAIKLREDDQLVDVVLCKANDQILLATAGGMAIRFPESHARSMGRNTSGVKGISLKRGDELVGMVVADPNATLLTACEFGYGKRTSFGPGDEMAGKEMEPLEDELNEDGSPREVAEVPETTEPEEADDISSANRYRTQRRGGKGVIDIKTSKRNGRVIGITPVTDDDELMMMTSRGKIQRVAAKDVSVIGRNTQGVRIMSMDEGDTLIAIVRVPSDALGDGEPQEGLATPPNGDQPVANSTQPESSNSSPESGGDE